MYPPDNSFLLNKFLFHLRVPLYAIQNASQVAKQYPEKMSISALNWLEKWMPVIDEWISDVERSRLLFHDGEEHGWDQILHNMAENMKDIAVACAEALNLEAHESHEGNLVVGLALNGSGYLNKLVQAVRSKDYQYLLRQH